MTSPGHYSKPHTINAPPRGVTLVEILIVIAILATLITLIGSRLFFSRQSTRITKSLANARQHAITFLSYTTDFKSEFPVLVPLKGGNLGGTDIGYTDFFRYFEYERSWHLALASSRNGTTPWVDAYRSPFEDARAQAVTRAILTDYVYPHAFIADPRFWSAETREELPNQLHAVRIDQVRTPTTKVLVTDALVNGMYLGSWNNDRIDRSVGRLAAFVDGHTENVSQDRWLIARLLDYGQDEHYGHGVRMFYPWLTTDMGIHGQDVRIAAP